MSISNNSFPDHVQLKLEQTLAQWPQWLGAEDIPGAPHISGILEGGVSNFNVLAQAAGQRFAIRIDGINPAANGLNRQAEWSAIQHAYAAGITARPRYFNPELGCLVCDYLAPDPKQEATPQQLARLLQQIHSLAKLHYRLDIPDRLRRYWRQIQKQGSALGDELAKFDAAIQTLIASSKLAQPQQTLCHHDLNPANLIISQGQVYALDWEYCAMGNPWFDLATLPQGQRYNEDKTRQFLQHYLGRNPQQQDWVSMEQQRCIAGYLELLWYASQKPDHLNQEQINTYLNTLEQRLHSTTVKQ